jgi:hypothetical protein
MTRARLFRPSTGASIAAQAALALVLAAAAPQGEPPPQLVRSEDAIVALFSLQTQLEVDGKMLQRLEERHTENVKLRGEARDKVAKLYVELDQLFDQYRAARQGPPPKEGKEDGGSPEGAAVAELEAQIEVKEQELLAAERAETGIQDEGRRLRDDIRDMREKIALLAQQIDTLQASLPTQRESLTGMWDITMMPSGDKGVFALFQSGTIVTGQYTLEGAFHGSLDGTLIDRKVLLHRIDARLGRSMDLSAFLSPDGQALRGTWENYDLANGQARTGSWSARRRQPRKGGEEGEGREGGP